MTGPGPGVSRPVSAIMFCAALALFGLISCFRINVSLLPRISLPRLSVAALAEGYSAEEIEKLVAVPLEETIRSSANAESLVTECVEGGALIDISYRADTDIDAALVELRDRLDGIFPALPEGAGRPRIYRHSEGSDAIMNIAAVPAEGQRLNSRIIKDGILARLERTEGVSKITAKGLVSDEISVIPDARLLALSGLKPTDILRRISETGTTVPAGTLIRGGMEYSVKTSGEFSSIEDLRRLPLKTDGRGRILYLEDLARIKKSPAERRDLFIYGESEAAGISVYMEPGFNTLKLCSRLREQISEINSGSGLPLRLEIVYDGSEYIRAALRDLLISAGAGAAAGFIILYLFLGDFKKGLIIFTAVPFSCTAAILALYLKGMSINLISLGGLSIGTGMLLDCSIVVLELIDREKKGHSAEEKCSAAVSAARGPLLISVLTSIVVFLPLVFSGGAAGGIFSDLAFTVTVSLLLSLLTALVLIPALYVTAGRGLSSGSGSAAALISRAENIYVRTLKKCMARPLPVLCSAALICSAAAYSIIKMDKKFLPESREERIRADLRFPPATDFSTVSTAVKKCVEELAVLYPHPGIFAEAGRDPDNVLSIFAKNSPADASIYLPQSACAESPERISVLLASISGAEVNLSRGQGPAAGMYDGRLHVRIGGGSMKQIEEAADEFINQLNLNGNPLLLESGIVRSQQRYEIRFDPDKLSSAGIEHAGALYETALLMRTRSAGFIRSSGEDTEIFLRPEESLLKNENEISLLPLCGNTGTALISGFASFSEKPAYARIIREQGTRACVIKAGLSGAHAEDAAKILKKTAYSRGLSCEISTGEERFSAALSPFISFFAVSFMLIYMILASGFESFSRPFTVLLSVPFAFPGVSLALHASSGSLNAVSLMGLILLSGLAVNSSVILLHGIELEIKKGGSYREAILRGSRKRLRPVLLTALTTICSMLPAALSRGPGSETGSALAFTVGGGLAVSMALTLICVPLIKLIFRGKTGTEQ